MARFDRGWLKLWRKSAFSDIGQNWTLFGAWNCLLVIANVQPSDCVWNGKRRKIERGQILTSYSELAELGQVNRRTATKWIDYLASRESIKIEKSPCGSKRGMIITILNFEKYQQNTNETDYFTQEEGVSSEQNTQEGTQDTTQEGAHVLEKLRIKEDNNNYEKLNPSKRFELSQSPDAILLKDFFKKNKVNQLRNIIPEILFHFDDIESFNVWYEGVTSSKTFPKNENYSEQTKYITTSIKREVGLIKESVVSHG